MKRVVLNVIMVVCCLVAIPLILSFKFDVEWIFTNRSHEYLMWSCRYQGFLIAMCFVGTAKYAREAYDWYQEYVQDRDRNVL